MIEKIIHYGLVVIVGFGSSWLALQVRLEGHEAKLTQLERDHSREESARQADTAAIREELRLLNLYGTRASAARLDVGEDKVKSLAADMTRLTEKVSAISSTTEATRTDVSWIRRALERNGQ